MDRLQGCEWEGGEGLGGCYPDVGFWREDGGECAQERVEVCFADGHFDVSCFWFSRLMYDFRSD